MNLLGFAEVWSLLVEGRAGLVVEVLVGARVTYFRWRNTLVDSVGITIVMYQESLTHFGLSQSNFMHGI